MNTKYYKEDGLIYKDNTKEILIGYDSKYDFPEEIILPDTIKVIEDRALSNLNEDKETITKLTIPSSVEKMGECILANTSVFQLIIEEDVKKIDYNAFAYSNIMLCDLPESLEEIDKCAFSNSNLQTINLENVKRIGSYAFSETNIDAVKMSNVEFIDDYAFCNCACLENVEIKAKKLIPIPKFCFSECSKLKSVELDNILSINPSAFVSTYELKTLNIPKECVSIDDSAFACSGLTSIFIPNNVHMIKYLAFYGCKNLKDFKIEEGIPGLPGLIIEEFAFKDCGIEELTLPSSVQILKNEACAQMPKLVKLTVNANVKSLPASFAYKCKRLSEIILSPEIKELQSYCFASTNINSVNENFKNVAVFGDSCFADCKNLEEVYIRKNTFLHRDVFAGCEHLKLAVILSFMSNNVFTGCYNFDLIAPSIEDYIREEIERNPDVNLITDFSDELIAKLTDFLSFKDVSKLVDGR